MAPCLTPQAFSSSFFSAEGIITRGIIALLVSLLNMRPKDRYREKERRKGEKDRKLVKTEKDETETEEMSMRKPRGG